MPKGIKGFIKGMPFTKEHKEKLRLAKLGTKASIETKIKHSFNKKGEKHPMYGKKHKPESIEKMSKSRMGVSPWNKGIGDKTPLNKKIRESKEYKLWRTAVFERDNYTCIWCFEKGGELQADHIKKFSMYPELRFAIDNGSTLCRKCHLTTDTWGNKKPNLINNYYGEKH